jgi:hypothetical protein
MFIPKKKYIFNTLRPYFWPQIVVKLWSKVYTFLKSCGHKHILFLKEPLVIVLKNDLSLRHHVSSVFSKKKRYIMFLIRIQYWRLMWHLHYYIVLVEFFMVRTKKTFKIHDILFSKKSIFFIYFFQHEKLPFIEGGKSHIPLFRRWDGHTIAFFWPKFDHKKSIFLRERETDFFKTFLTFFYFLMIPLIFTYLYILKLLYYLIMYYLLP